MLLLAPPNRIRTIAFLTCLTNVPDPVRTYLSESLKEEDLGLASLSAPADSPLAFTKAGFGCSAMMADDLGRKMREVDVMRLQLSGDRSQLMLSTFFFLKKADIYVDLYLSASS